MCPAYFQSGGMIMSKYLKKTNLNKIWIMLGITSLILSSVCLTNAHSFGRRGDSEKTSLDKITTFATQLNAEGGQLNTVSITKTEGEGPIMLQKGYVFARDGLSVGNIHFHNLIVDGITIAHFGGGVANYVEGAENEPKPRGGEVRHLLHSFMNSDDIEVLANESITFDFMAAISNDPNPTPATVLVHVKSLQDAVINIEIVQ